LQQLMPWHYLAKVELIENRDKAWWDQQRRSQEEN